MATSFSMSLGHDPNDDEIDRRIEQAFAAPSRTSAAAESSRVMPSAHVESISRQFRANPTKVLAEAIPPEEKPEDISEWDTGGRIQAMVDFHNSHQQRLREVSKIALRRFAELVDASINISHSSSHSDPIRVYLRPDPVYTRVAAAAGAAPIQSVFITPEGGTVAAGTAAAGGAGPAFAVPSAKLSEAQDYRYAQAVRSALERVEVTGEFTLAPVVFMGVERSLASLIEADPVKFAGAVLDDFLHDDQAMRYMAFLCSAHITNTRIKNPSRYYLDKNENRRTHEILELTAIMARSLERSRENEPFVYSGARDQKRYMSAGRTDVLSGLRSDDTGAIYVRGATRKIRRKNY